MGLLDGLGADDAAKVDKTKKKPTPRVRVVPPDAPPRLYGDGQAELEDQAEAAKRAKTKGGGLW